MQPPNSSRTARNNLAHTGQLDLDYIMHNLQFARGREVRPRPSPHAPSRKEAGRRRCLPLAWDRSAEHQVFHLSQTTSSLCPFIPFRVMIRPPKVSNDSFTETGSCLHCLCCVGISAFGTTRLQRCTLHVSHDTFNKLFGQQFEPHAISRLGNGSSTRSVLHLLDTWSLRHSLIECRSQSQLGQEHSQGLHLLRIYLMQDRREL